MRRSRSRAVRSARLLLLVLALGLMLIVVGHSLARSRQPALEAGQACPEPYPATRNPSNPLDLRKAPGPNPLHGARFFVPGPANGNAAEAIASLVGLNPDSLSNSESWRTFHHQLQSGPLHAKLADDPALAHKVALLSKIASQPQAQRFSNVSAGGSPAGIFGQVQKIFCANLQADPGTIPIITTYFLHPTLGGCPTAAQVRHYMPRFKQQIDAVADGTGRRPAVYLLELDAIGSSICISHDGALPEWEAALRDEMARLQALPHTVVYVEGGYSDSNSPAYTAKVLKAIDVHTIRGFFTNDTHNNWTINEDRWATTVARLVGGSHYIVNTASNGRGPKLNPDPATQGAEDICNPPGRGIGIRDTVHTGWKDADAYLWEHTPGQSAGCGGGPSAGVFWPTHAEQLAARANSQLGPGFPSKPY